jgi:hypothetical protein
MKALMLLAVAIVGLAVGGCSCSDYSWYPKNTFVGSSGWPSEQVPVGHVPAVDSSVGMAPNY